MNTRSTREVGAAFGLLVPVLSAALVVTAAAPATTWFDLTLALQRVDAHVALTSVGLIATFGSGALAFAAGHASLGLAVTALGLVSVLGLRDAASMWVLVAPLTLLILSLARTSVGGHPPSWLWIVAGSCLIVSVAIVLLRAATYDPFLDPACADTCGSAKPIIDIGASGARTVRRTAELVAITEGVALASIAAWSFVRPRSPIDGPLRVPDIGGVVIGAGVATSSFAATGAWITAVGLVTLGAGIGLLAAGDIRVRTRLRGVVEGIEAAPSPGALEDRLRDALGDDDLRVAYPVPDGIAHVAADGSTFIAPPWSPMVTTIRRGDAEIVLIFHGRPIATVAIQREIGEGVRAAVDNERLAAVARFRLRELRESAGRVITAADGERRRIERDLHDGVQQRLLAITFGLRLIRSEAERAGAPAAAAASAAAETAAEDALARLRAVASETHPAILGQAGLVAALQALADATPVPFGVEGLSTDRLGSALEAAAYRIVDDLLRDAVDRGATSCQVSIERAPETLRLQWWAGPVVADAPERVRDRVAALGGTIKMGVTDDSGIIIVSMPCE